MSFANELRPMPVPNDSMCLDQLDSHAAAWMKDARRQRGLSGSTTLAHVANEGHEAAAATRRLGVPCATRRSGGAWREAASWRGTRAATERADREIRLRLAERSLRATGPDADRRRRLQLAEATR